MNIWYESGWRRWAKGIASFIRSTESDEGGFFSTKAKVFQLFQARPCNSERLQYKKDHRGSSDEIWARVGSMALSSAVTEVGWSELGLTLILLNNLPASFGATR